MPDNSTTTQQILQDIHEDLQLIIEQDKTRRECETQIKSEVKDLRTLLIGLDGTNGLRSVSKLHDTAIDDLKKWKTQVMVALALMQMFFVPVVIYLLQQMFK